MPPARPLSALQRATLAHYAPGEHATRVDPATGATLRRGKCAACGALLGETDPSAVRYPASGPTGLFCAAHAPPEDRDAP